MSNYDCDHCIHAGIETSGDVAACNICEDGSNFETCICNSCKHHYAIELDCRHASLEDAFACKYCCGDSMYEAIA